MTAATSRVSTKIIPMTSMPIRMPAGSTRVAFSNLTNKDAPTEPMAMPTAKMAINLVASCSSRPNLIDVHRSTTNCKVAPAPQNKVVTANETLP